AAGPPGCGAPRDLPGLQRGVLGVGGRLADPRRPFRRGDPARATPGRATARPGSARAARADAAPRVPPLRPHDAGRRAGPPGRPGSLALEPGADRGGTPPGRPGAGLAADRAVHDPGGDRGRARPGAELNRAVAVAMRDGPAAGLAQVDAILARGELLEYHLAYSARADLCRRLGRTAEARAAYERALALARQEPERRFLARRLRELPA